MTPDLPLIVGAGPVGKAAALLLARAGRPTRLIDRASEPSSLSKALAINPRTLKLLEDTGVTDDLLHIGLRIRGAQLWIEGEPAAEIRFDRLPHDYPFMLALSQAATERMLEKGLHAAGGGVETGRALKACRITPEGVRSELSDELEGARETADSPWLLAADGAHSTTREQLGVSFQGTQFQRPWHLADIPLSTSLDSDHTHVFFLKGGGFVFVMRVIDEGSQAAGAPDLWRVVSNLENPAERIPRAEPAGPPTWTSQFQVAHRICGRFRVGPVSFAGDAAHVHSPAGARGMNLGIEDAWVFCRLLEENRLDDYDLLRRSVVRRVVRRVELVSRAARGESIVARVARFAAARSLGRIARLRGEISRTIAGLDHPLDLHGRSRRQAESR